MDLGDLDPLTRKVLLQLSPPTPTDNRADIDRLRLALEHQVGLVTTLASSRPGHRAPYQPPGACLLPA
ncbi:hypothetical protein [Thermosinus carboxydivorans]|uniref:hypothetical protein n=1 Tax=Thermosinus carboxydivorans TaxID=261685 RepID=UPI0038CD33AB